MSVQYVALTLVEPKLTILKEKNIYCSLFFAVFLLAEIAMEIEKKKIQYGGFLILSASTASLCTSIILMNSSVSLCNS